MDKKDSANQKKPPRQKISQSDVPSHTLQDAMRVPRALADELGKQPSKPLHVAKAMGMAPTTGKFRSLTGAALAYGLTEGGAFADHIGLTDLGRRVVAPTAEGDDQRALREALLRPRVIREFLEKYNGSRLPSDAIAVNVLETLGVPQNRCPDVFRLIKDSANQLGLVQDINGQAFVDLDGTTTGNADAASDQQSSLETGDLQESNESAREPTSEEPAVVRLPLSENRRVFITHGKSREIAGQLKELLTFGDFEPVVSVEKDTTAKPVPEKVLDDMRSSGAAIVHARGEMRCVDAEGNEHQMLNPNVLIEIGAAMALYGRRFILLVEEGVELPSNLQGLYEVRYSGDRLDYDATMRLLKAFNDFKS